jgi:hypothetical protein
MTVSERPETEVPGSTAASGTPGLSTVEGDSAPAHRVGTLPLAAACYLVLALGLWWHVWSSRPTSTTTCGCGDSSLFTWFLDWPAYAIAHGLNPLYSTALFHPTGVNLLSNTAVVGIGVVLAPVTWLFGPVATLNVALTLSPALSALAMFVLVRRWVSWTPAAFIAGLLYGFSPFILIALTDAHLMLAMAPLPPLMVACLDEILVRQRRKPWATGVLLGVLVAAQFFIGSEVLVLTAIVAAMGVVVVVVYALVHRDVLRRKARSAVTGLAAAAATAAALLAYPVWFALAGPAHLAGPVWGPDSDISYGGNSLRDYVLPSAPSPAFTALAHRFGGYQAPTLSGQYFGIGLLAVLVIGLVVWRGDRRLWLFGVLGVISVPLSMGLQFHQWTLWRLFVRLPLMDNIIPSRFLLTTYLAAAVMLGLIVDHAHRAATRWRADSPDHRRSGAPARGRLVGAVVGVAVAAVALVPIAGYYASGVPLTTQPVVLPAWFRTVAPHLVGRQVVLAFPVPFALFQSAMTWQAVDGMSFAMVGGGGPDALPERAGAESAGQTAIGNLSISAGAQGITPAEVTSVRRALDGWGVTTVVVPDPSGLPGYEQLHLVRTAVMVITAATGQAPVRRADAWVWTGVDHAGAPVLSSAEQFTACGAGPADGTVADIDRSAACVLSGPTAGG